MGDRIEFYEINDARKAKAKLFYMVEKNKPNNNFILFFSSPEERRVIDIEKFQGYDDALIELMKYLVLVPREKGEDVTGVAVYDVSFDRIKRIK